MFCQTCKPLFFLLPYVFLTQYFSTMRKIFTDLNVKWIAKARAEPSPNHRIMIKEKGPIHQVSPSVDDIIFEHRGVFYLIQPDGFSTEILTLERGTNLAFAQAECLLTSAQLLMLWRI